MPSCPKLNLKLKPQKAKTLLTKRNAKPATNDSSIKSTPALPVVHLSTHAGSQQPNTLFSRDQEILSEPSRHLQKKAGKREKVKNFLKKIFQSSKQSGFNAPPQPSSSSLPETVETSTTISPSDTVALIERQPEEQETELQDVESEDLSVVRGSVTVEPQVHLAFRRPVLRPEIVIPSQIFDNLQQLSPVSPEYIRALGGRRSVQRTLGNSISLANHIFISSSRGISQEVDHALQLAPMLPQPTPSVNQNAIMLQPVQPVDANQSSQSAAFVLLVITAIAFVATAGYVGLLLEPPAVDEEYETLPFDRAEAWLEFYDYYVDIYNIIHTQGHAVIICHGKTYLVTRQVEVVNNRYELSFGMLRLREKEAPIFKSYNIPSLEELVDSFQPTPFTNETATGAPHEEEVEKLEPKDVEVCEEHIASSDSSEAGSSTSSPVQRDESQTPPEEHYGSIDECRADYEAAFKMSEGNHANEIEDLKEDHEAALRDLRERYEAQIKDLKKEHCEARRAANRDLLAAKKQLREKDAEDIMSVKSEVAALEKSLAGLQERHRISQETCVFLQNQVAEILGKNRKLEAQLLHATRANEKWQRWHTEKVNPTFTSMKEKLAHLQTQQTALQDRFDDLSSDYGALKSQMHDEVVKKQLAETAIQQQTAVITALTRDLEVTYSNDDVEQGLDAFSFRPNNEKDLQQQLAMTQENCKERGEQIAALQAETTEQLKILKQICLKKGMLEMELKEVKGAVKTSEEFRNAIYIASSGGALLPEGMEKLLASEAKISKILHEQADKISELETSVMLIARARRDETLELQEKHRKLEATEAELLNLQKTLEENEAIRENLSAYVETLENDLKAWQDQCENQAFSDTKDILYLKAKQTIDALSREKAIVEKSLIRQDLAIWRGQEALNLSKYAYYMLQTAPKDPRLALGREHQRIIGAEFDHSFKWMSIHGITDEVIPNAADVECDVRQYQMSYAMEHYDQTGDLNDAVMGQCLQRALEELKGKYPFLDNFICKATIVQKKGDNGSQPSNGAN